MKKSWWKEAVVYQIYPRSFKDSNGDGIGDLGGIIEKMDYLKDLGIDLIWCSPIFKSPNDDNGYDVSDYRAIMDEFGTMKQFDELLEGLHQRGIKLLLDLVPNHSSDEHFWFQESRKSKDSPYRDYYIWRDKPASNWTSFFSGSAWEYDEVAQEYYLHLFSKKQPDLNWENPKVRQEMQDIMRFWFEKGVDGFRIDVLPFISKRLDFPDIDPNNFADAVWNTYANGPRIHEFLKEINQNVLKDFDVTTIAEGIGVTPQQALDYVDEDRKELDMLYHFDHMMMTYGADGKYDIKEWSLVEFKAIFSRWDKAMEEQGWVTLFLDNHDFPRMVSRFGDAEYYRVESAKLLATLLLSLRGTPCIYQGSEIGMTNIWLDKIEDFDDLEIHNLVAELHEKGEDPTEMISAFNKMGRDNARTPVQWDSSKNAGFTTGKPWLKINPNHKEINVAAALKDPNSIFYYYQKMLQLRKLHPTLVYGNFEDVEPESEELFVYRRWDEHNEYWIFLNFSDETILLFNIQQLPDDLLLIGNYTEEYRLDAELQPWEARVYKIR